jgi:hypothetical protein
MHYLNFKKNLKFKMCSLTSDTKLHRMTYCRHRSVRKMCLDWGQRYSHDVSQVEWLLRLIGEHGVQRLAAGSTAQGLA